MNLVAYLLSGNVLLSIVGALFGALAYFHVVLPPGITSAGVVGEATLGLTTLLAIIRFTTNGPGDAKAWYESKTIWAQIVAFGATGATMAGAPAADQQQIVSLIMIAVSLVTMGLHASSTGGEIVPVAAKS